MHAIHIMGRLCTSVHSRELYVGVFHAGVPGVKPVIVELTDFKTKEKVDELEVDAVLVATGRAPYTQASLVTFIRPLTLS